ncbi:MAG: cation:proton antiporter [Tannerellaceae bacterium]
MIQETLLHTLLFSPFNMTLPIENPVVKFLIILLIILVAPMVLNKLRIPSILGLIIAGAIVGPNGFNLILRDSSIILSGTAGLLYIMFLAGLEIDLTEFKKNSHKSALFGLYTFCIPMTLGILLGYYILGFSMLTSVLLASMFASHTLIAYPIVNKLGVGRNRAVTVTIGGTMITDTLALLVLAVIVGMTQGNVDGAFWLRLTGSILLFGCIVLFGFPVIARIFFKHYSDNVSQYIFVLAMVFLGAVLAEAAGIEAIIGAFLSGLALNRLIPHSSPLMNRVEFIGNAIFIPFFLIGVGMLIDYRVFFAGWNTILVALSMTVVATLAKYLAAWAASRTFKYTKAEMLVMFGLSNAQAAATLAAVMVGYNVILGHTPEGDPIRLLNDSVLNGTIVMIFITCTIATLCAQKGAHTLSMHEADAAEGDEASVVAAADNSFMISVHNPKHVDELINLAGAMRPKRAVGEMVAVNVIDNRGNDAVQQKRSKRMLDHAVQVASAADMVLNTCLRYDVNFINGIVGAMREYRTTDLILGVDKSLYLSKSTLGNVIKGVINESTGNVYIYRAEQPLATIKRIFVIVPPEAEKENGFPFWVNRLWNMARSTGSQLVIYGSEATLSILEGVNENNPVDLTTHTLAAYDDMLIVAKEMHSNDALVFVMSRRHNPSYNAAMEKIPAYIDAYFSGSNFILLFPMQERNMLYL